jgi:hypothetical protein
VYVFFAVLVIVIFSSSVLMTRSFVYRRRQRHLIEGGIRNGTWTPTDDGVDFGDGHGLHGRNVDLSKEPKMWEMFIRKEQQVEGSNGRGGMSGEWWESMKPPSAIAANNTPSLPTDKTRRIRRYLSMTDASPLPEPNIIASNNDSTNPKMISDVKSVSSATNPQSITVAALIAMPSQARSSRPSRFRQSAPYSLLSLKPPSVFSLSLEPDPSSVIPARGTSMQSISPTSLLPQQAKPLPEDEAEAFPDIEIGIVELVIREETHKEG